MDAEERGIPQATADPEAWAAAQVEAVVTEAVSRAAEAKPKRKRRKVRGVFLKPGKEAGVWWIRYWCHYGHRHEERIGPRALAEEMVEKRRVAVKTEDYCPTRAREAKRKAKPTLFKEARARYIEWAEAKRPRSITFREKALKHLGAAFDPMPLPGITPGEVEGDQARRRAEGAAPATVNRERAVLSHLFAKAISWGLAKANPVAGTERQDEANEDPRPLTPDEETRLLACLPKGKRGWPYWREMVTLDANKGLRLGEWRHQAWADIDLPGGFLTVTRPKSGKAETVPLNSVARGILAGLERRGALVFPDLPTKVSDVFVKFAARAKLDGVTFHCLRDTFISRIAPHVSTPALMALARHRDYRTTRRYVKVDDVRLREAVERLTAAHCAPVPTLVELCPPGKESLGGAP